MFDVQSRTLFSILSSEHQLDILGNLLIRYHAESSIETVDAAFMSVL